MIRSSEVKFFQTFIKSSQDCNTFFILFFSPGRQPHRRNRLTQHSLPNLRRSGRTVPEPSLPAEPQLRGHPGRPHLRHRWHLRVGGVGLLCGGALHAGRTNRRPRVDVLRGGSVSRVRSKGGRGGGWFVFGAAR